MIQQVTLDFLRQGPSRPIPSERNHGMVEFRLLSALEVWADGQLVPLGHSRQQCVLAVLLLDPNRPVSADQLVYRVWGDEAPERAQSTLYSYISRLRGALSLHGCHLLRRSGGYVLRVDDAAVDLYRFRHLIKQAKEAADDHRAGALLEEGIGLWHGEPLAGLSSPWLDAVRERLEAERWAAELDHTDAMLRTDRHSERLASLSAWAATHPLDERLTGQLLIALHRSGRTADALEQYRRTRLLLSEELGSDPGVALRDLHQRILSGDRALDPPAGPAVRHLRGDPVPAPVPQQLPAPPAQFIGRHAELARLDAALTDDEGSARIAVLGGIGGIGKTWLALRWAGDHLERFPDGQLYVNLRGFEPHHQPLSAQSVIRSFLYALGVTRGSIPEEPEARVGLYRSLVAGRRVLVVLDNARDAQQVRPLLPGSGSCTVIVTSREQMPELIATDGARPVTPAVLTPVEARTLLTHRLGDQRAADEPEAVDHIITACAGLPLALAIVAARAATHTTFSLSMLAGELRQSSGGLEAFAHSGATLNLRSVFSWSCRALSPDAGTLFRLLGTHPGPEISRRAAASLVGLSLRRTRAALAELVRGQLIIEYRPGRYTLHDLIRAYATELADEPAHHTEQHVALLRAISHYTHSAQQAAALIEPYRTRIALAPVDPGVIPECPDDAREALAWLTTEHAVLLAFIARTTRQGLDTHTWQLAWILSQFHAGQSHLDEWLLTQSAGLRAAERLDDRLGQALSHRALARVLTRLNRYVDAGSHATRALSLFRDLGDVTGQARTHLSLGWLLDQQGRHQDALGHVTRARLLFRSAGHTAGEARALNAGGWSRTLLGDFERAIGDCKEALELLRGLDDRTGEAATWDTLGHAYHRSGRHDDAAGSYRQAIELYQALGDRYWEAQTLTRLADAYDSTSDSSAAAVARFRARTILDGIGHPGADRLRAPA